MSEQRLFISHANEDGAVASRIVAYLEAQGVRCWISSRDIPPQAIYADAITAAMQECSACAVIVSAPSNASKAVKRELELASHYDRPFIPIRIDDTEPAAGVNYYLRNTQWLDYKRDGERALDRIAAQMSGAPAAPSSRPTPPRPSGRFPLVPVLAVAALAVLGVGGWFVTTKLLPTANDRAVSAETLAPLLGSYHWQGVACGDGPTVALEGEQLVFTMPNTPTFRHELVSTQTGGDGALDVRTRVLEPAGHAGETYALALSADAAQLRVNEEAWDRCDGGAADQSAANAPTAAALNGSTWWGAWGDDNAQMGWQLRADGTACFLFHHGQTSDTCDRTWRLDGSTLTVESVPEIWTGEIVGNVYSGTFGLKADPAQRTTFEFTRD